MDYFVSIENCQFFRWQIELLYESMRIFGLENNLVIGCADLEKKTLRFPRVFYHENYGRKNKYLPFNKTYSLCFALKNKLIKQPFAIIDPDMIMVNPLKHSDNSYAQYYPFLEYKNLKLINCYFDVEEENWRPGGLVYYFNNIDENLICGVHDLLIRMHQFYDHDVCKKHSFFWQIEMIAFSYILSKASTNIAYNLVSNLSEDKDCDFIHYSTCFGPYFSKRIHNNLREFSLGEALPFNSILKMPNKNKNVVKLKQVTKSFLDFRDKNL